MICGVLPFQGWLFRWSMFFPLNIKLCSQKSLSLEHSDFGHTWSNSIWGFWTLCVSLFINKDLRYIGHTYLEKNKGVHCKLQICALTNFKSHWQTLWYNIVWRFQNKIQLRYQDNIRSLNFHCFGHSNINWQELNCRHRIEVLALCCPH
jgi:hypothetical protein